MEPKEIKITLAYFGMCIIGGIILIAGLFSASEIDKVIINDKFPHESISLVDTGEHKPDSLIQLTIPNTKP